MVVLERFKNKRAWRVGRRKEEFIHEKKRKLSLELAAALEGGLSSRSEGARLFLEETTLHHDSSGKKSDRRTLAIPLLFFCCWHQPQP